MRRPLIGLYQGILHPNAFLDVSTVSRKASQAGSLAEM